MLNKIFSMNISEDETASLVFFGWIEHDLADLQPV